MISYVKSLSEKGTRIDGRFYVKMEACVNQRTSLDNPSTCKLPINGRRYSDRNAQNISLVSLGIPYQLNYNIYKYIYTMTMYVCTVDRQIAQGDC